MNEQKPDFINLTNLVAENFGGKIIYCNDEFFAPASNLLKKGRGIFIEDKYTDRGKWMDGWETRRKRTKGHDFCIIELGARGCIKGLEVDTNHFLGNHAPFASIEAMDTTQEFSREDFLFLDQNEAKKNYSFEEILPKVPLNPGSVHHFVIDNIKKYTHIKLNIYPDGGIARFRVYGEVYKDWENWNRDRYLDLASAKNGARAILCNDMFFSHMENILMPGRGKNMGDGWETKRNRTPNNEDFVLIRLAHPGKIDKILVDTCHFKGNYPDSCKIEGAYIEDFNDLKPKEIDWKEILPSQKLQADLEHFFAGEIKNFPKVNIVKLTIYPDGGISRLRLMGKIC